MRRAGSTRRAVVPPRQRLDVRRVLDVVAAVVAAAALVLASAFSAAAAERATAGVPAADADPAAPARIELSSLGPTLLGPMSTLTITGAITNTGATPLELVSARVRLQSSALGTRTEVAAWSQSTDETPGTVVGPTLDVQPRTLPAAGRTAFTLSVPAAQLGLGDRPFGAYGVAIEVRAQRPVGRQQVGLLRTTVQWQPGTKQYAAQQLAWLVPITGVPTGAGGRAATPTELAAAVGPGSRLRRVLDAASAPGVGWAVDPALLQALDEVVTPRTTTPQPETPAPTPSPDPVASSLVETYLTDLRLAARGRVVIELPYADPDLAAVTAAGRPDLLQTARAAGAGIISQVLGVAPTTQVAWPAQGWADDEAVRVIAAAGARDVVLDARARRLEDPLPYTPDARVTLAGGVSGWLADPVLSELAGAARRADPARVRRLLAETAAATSERPGLTRRLLIAAPRDLDPDPAAFRALVDASSSVPWLTVVPPTALRQPPPGDTDTADLRRLTRPAPAAVNRAQLAASHVASVRRMRSALAALGEVVDAPGTVTDPVQRSTLQLLSAGWRGRPAELRLRRGQVGEQVRALTNAVRVLSSSVNFLASSGRLQITVANDLAEEVSGLRLRVTSANPRLQVVDGDVPAPTVAASTRTQVLVPVRVLGSGVVPLNAQLVAPSGRPVGQAVQVRVRARPTGSWALAVLGGVAGLVLVVGLVRALRRPRRSRLVAP